MPDLRRLATAGLASCCLLLGAPLPASAADPNKVLRIAFEIEETGFDPAKVSDNYSSQILLEVMESLLTYDYLARPAKLVPLTAESLPEVTDDGKTYLFRVRKGIYFHPDPAFNGQRRELTAADYAYSIKRLADPKNRSPWRFLVEGKIVGLDELTKKAEAGAPFDYKAPIRGLELVDRYTLRIRLTGTDYNFSYIMGMPAISAVAHEVIDAYAEDTNAHPVGTGPYVFKSWLRKTKMVLEANPEYREVIWDFKGSDNPRDQAAVAAMKGKRIPQIGRVEINVIAEEQSRWLAFQNRQIDYIDRFGSFADIAIPDNQVAPNLAARGITLDRSVEPEITYYALDMQDPVVGGFSKEKIALRRAIFMSFDNSEYVRVIRKNQAMIAQYPIPPGVVGHDPDYKTSIPYDPDLANKLLDSLGYKRGVDGFRTWPDGRPLVWRYSSTPSSRDRELDELWQKSLQRIGIRFQVDKNKFPEELKKERACQLPSRTAAWIADYPDGDDFMQLLYGPNSHQNNTACFQLAEWDRIYEKTRALPPESSERNQLYRQLWRMAEVNAVWKLHDTRYRNMLVQPQVIGYRKHPILLAEFMYYDLDNSRRSR
jgi:peptide/nickel transport system substrate-binding protein